MAFLMGPWGWLVWSVSDSTLPSFLIQILMAKDPIGHRNIHRQNVNIFILKTTWPLKKTILTLVISTFKLKISLPQLLSLSIKFRHTQVVILFFGTAYASNYQFPWQSQGISHQIRNILFMFMKISCKISLRFFELTF